MRKNFGLVVALMMFLLSSCTCSKKLEGSSADIRGEWIIETAMGVNTEGGEKQAFINFGDDGKMNGCATVNNFFGGYTNQDGKLTFSAIGMTRMMGPSMDKEDAIVQAVNSASSIKVKGNTATVADKDGKTLMVLRRK